MRKIVGICVVLGLLGASLEGAADIAAFAQPCGTGNTSVRLDPIDDNLEPSGESAAEEGCVVCTPLCHCGAHGSAIIADWPHGASAPPNAAPAHAETCCASFLDPPFLPPPIR